jgi:hypothetical protein
MTGGSGTMPPMTGIGKSRPIWRAPVCGFSYRRGARHPRSPTKICPSLVQPRTCSVGFHPAMFSGLPPERGTTRFKGPNPCAAINHLSSGDTSRPRTPSSVIGLGIAAGDVLNPGARRPACFLTEVDYVPVVREETAAAEGRQAGRIEPPRCPAPIGKRNTACAFPSPCESAQCLSCEITSP